MAAQSRLLIATDEAGYGPKLGPLVIVATAWKIPAESTLEDTFAPLRGQQQCGDTSVAVKDSKTVFKPGEGLAALHAVVSASHHWCGRTESTLPEILPWIAPQDFESITRTAWLAELGQQQFLLPHTTAGLLTRWQSTGIELLQVKARVITAAVFNDACDLGYNKADLLSESTIGLVRRLIESEGDAISENLDVDVFCDRHGGRRYYGGVLQHMFPDVVVRVVAEEKRESRYVLVDHDRSIAFRFTVKGDSFTPVALSSMHAKYLRERMMESFNRYFLSLHTEGAPLRPTAGYPQDADRFLAEIKPILERQKIAADQLIRSR